MVMNRKKALILGSAVLLVLLVAGGAAWLMVTSGGELQYKTQAALRKALPTKAADELIGEIRELAAIGHTALDSLWHEFVSL